MDITGITQLVSSVGFPICCCIYLIYTNQKQTENHKLEIDKLRETVENNTHVMIKLAEKLGANYETNIQDE